jgi:hypothetical protein
MFQTSGDVERVLSPHIRAVDIEINPATKQERIDSVMAPYGPNGQWKYAPDAEKAAKRGEAVAEYERESGEALYALEQRASKANQWLEPEEQRSMEPPDPSRAWMGERRVVGIPPADIIGLSVLDELRRVRFSQEYGEALPDVLDRAYGAALANPLDQANASLVRWIEGRHGAGWAGRGVDGDVDQAMAAQRLHTRIQAARLARIPNELKAARTVIDGARALANRARANGVRPQIECMSTMRCPGR